MEYTILLQIGITLVLSLLIGIEREQKQQKSKHFHFGGVRTFILLGLFGVLTGILAQKTFAVIYINSLIVTAIILASYFLHAFYQKKYGITTELSGIITFFVGILVSSNQLLVATVISLITATIMHFKSSLHTWAKSLSNQDLIAALQFILITFVILPILPDQQYGPFQFFNPHQTWLMVVLITTLSYISYIAIKLVGSKRGICLTGFLAGFISSTALTLTFAKQSLDNKKIINPYAVAIIIASSAMFFRVIVEIAVINPELLKSTSLPLAVMGGIGMLSGFHLLFKKEPTSAKNVEGEISNLSSPLQLISAIKFAGYFVVVLFLTKAATDLFGDKGVYVSSILSGVVDVDAITVSLASLAGEKTITAQAATIGITIAAITNTFTKFAFFTFLGNKAVTKKLLPAFSAMAAAGLVLSFSISF